MFNQHTIAQRRRELAEMYARNGLHSSAQAVRDQGPTMNESDPELTLVKLPFDLYATTAQLTTPRSPPRQRIGGIPLSGEQR